MIGSFTYESLPCRVVFGSGTLGTVNAEVRRLGGKRALVLTSSQQMTQGVSLADELGSLCAGIFSDATMHTPVEVTERALTALRTCQADCVISLGGGSTIGLGKALALRTGVNQLCIPTTYAGSEMTPILGETRDGRKTALRSAAVLPETVVYDVDLTMTLPAKLAATSGINAIAHAAEALYAQEANPVISLMAEEGIRALAHALPVIASQATITTRAPKHSTAHGFAGFVSVPSEWHCITSFVTCSVVGSIFRIRKCTPSFSRMRWPIMRRQPPTPRLASPRQ